MNANLTVNIGKMKLKNPVMAASGTWGIESGELSDIDKLGAIVLKTITLEERPGNPPPSPTRCRRWNAPRAPTPSAGPPASSAAAPFPGPPPPNRYSNSPGGFS